MNSGLNRKAATQEWQRLFSNPSSRKDQVDANDKDGVPLGKAGPGRSFDR